MPRCDTELALLSARFLAEKRVHRYHLKKISDMTGDEVIRACHWYVEENHLTREWKAFRREQEAQRRCNPK